MDAAVEEPTPLQNEVKGISKMLGAGVVVIAIVVMLTIILVDGVTEPSDLVVVLLLGVSLAVAAVPEGLPTILSVVLAIGVQRMAKRNTVVKKLSSVEALGSASVICTDKTGTLTRNEMTIQRIVTASGTAEVRGVGYRPEGAVLSGGHPPLDDHLYKAQRVLRAGSLADNAQLTERAGEREIVGDPTEAAFLVAARKLEGTTIQMNRCERLAEIPFTSERTMMSTLHQESSDGRRLLLLSKGAPDVLMSRCTRHQVGGETVPLTDEARAGRLAEIESLSAEAFRTLGVAYRTVAEESAEGSGSGDELDPSWEGDLVYVGVVGITGFTTLVLAQLFNSLSARSETSSAFHGLFANPWLWGAIGLGVALQIAVVEVPFLQVAFGTASLDLTHWTACVALGSVVLWYDELRTLLLRLTDHRSDAHRQLRGHVVAPHIHAHVGSRGRLQPER